MWRTVYVVVLGAVFVVLNVSQVIAAITIDSVPVGNPGNAPDPADGDDFTAGVQNLGAVNYSYSIGKYDVTVGQYTAFLNAVAATDNYYLYTPSMATDLLVAGIEQNGSPGSYTYSVIGSPNHPIAYVSWASAVRFANWLSNDQPTGAEGPGTTETGSYTLNGAIYTNDLNAVMRNSNATWVIPTENEWYKAAYYNPATSSYYQYPFSSNSEPTSAPPGSTPNTANFIGPKGNAVTGSPTLDLTQNLLTDVGAYTASVSPYGAFDMGGDVSQWDESLNGFYRVNRGGSAGSGSYALASSDTSAGFASVGYEFAGFRVALVPEPNTLALLGLGSIGLLVRRRANR